MTSPVTETFTRALRLEGRARAAFLEETCGGDAEFRREVDTMLADAERADDLFGDDGDGSVGLLNFVRPVSEQPGDAFGPYTLLQQIGEGGFGVVWRAEQSQPIRRTVALKVIKAGMDTKQVLARFEAERQALAMMDHPNIARVLDAGATPTGRPYFAMELVKGIPITEFCDQQKLNTRQRLELFCDVCSAVAHAHQKGVIHRDLKPSNVMVSLNGDHGVAKVIDFGISKATEQKLADQSRCTRFGQFLGTPVYMSPEQAAMNTADIDTRTDIYSLGMLLYELLAGRPAFDPTILHSVGYDEMRRIIREDEPPKPSVGLTQSRVRSQSKSCEPSAHPPSPFPFSADLDWIVMKALEKDRTRRYQTANALSADIHRHLNDEPVLARPASKVYRLQKAFRRNKLASTAAAAVLVALIAGALVSAWQAIEATKARNAEREQRLAAQSERDAKAAALQEAEDISTFLTGVFQIPDPERNGPAITAAEILAIAAKKLDADLASQPARRAKLQSTLGRTYSALGLSPDAVPLQERALDYYRTTLGPEHPDTLDAMKDLAYSYKQALLNDEALKLYEDVLALDRKVLGPDHTDTINAMGYLARCYNVAERYDEALKLNEEALPRSLRAHGPEDPVTLRAMRRLSESYRLAGRLEEAIRLGEETLASCRKVRGSEHLDTLHAMHFLGESYRDASRLDEAITLMDESVLRSRKVLGPEHRGTAVEMTLLAECYSLAGRRDEALKLREEVLKLTRQGFGPEFPATLFATKALAYSYDETGRRNDALKLREELLPLYRKVRGPEHPGTLSIMQELAYSYGESDRRDEELKLREELVPLCRKVLGLEHSDTLTAMLDLANSYSRSGRNEEALKIRDEVNTVKKAARARQTAGFPPIHATLVAPDAEWKWLHPTDGTDPAGGWPGFHREFALPAFDDSTWTTGHDKGGLMGGFGYGDVFDGVDIGKPENESHRHTAYFRHTFTTDSEHARLELRCQRDDGIIVYLDGKEVLRDNVEPGEEAYLLHSKKFMGVENDGVVHRLPLPGTITPGPHTLAISVHNAAKDSSDLYLGGVTLVEVEAGADVK